MPYLFPYGSVRKSPVGEKSAPSFSQRADLQATLPGMGLAGNQMAV